VSTATWSRFRRRLVIVGDEAFTRAEWAAIPHGTAGGYVHHGCRCDRCRAWRKARP
jgi:hypothetical protein